MKLPLQLYKISTKHINSNIKHRYTGEEYNYFNVILKKSQLDNTVYSF